jgi:amino acid transporter
MGSFEGAVLIILIIIIIFLLFILRIFWEVFATSMTLKLLQNSSGNYSTQKILVWVFVMISIVLLVNFFSKKRTVRASLSRTQE